MRILILNYEFPPLGGGAGNATYYLLKELSKYNDIEIDLVTSSPDKFSIGLFSENIVIHKLNIGKSNNLNYQTSAELLKYLYKSLIYSKKLIKIKKYDLVHAFFGIPCGFVAMLLKLPYIVSLRGSDVPFYNQRFRLYDKLFFKYISRIIWKNSRYTISNSKKLKALAIRVSRKQNILVIPNGVESEKVRNDNRIAHEHFTINTTARLIERKGIVYLIDAFAKLYKKHPDCRLVIVGDGDQKKLLVNHANSLGIDKAVNFAGTVPHSNVLQILRASDVFVLPSLNEGMSNAILEAMSSGLPIITTDTGGTDELIDSSNGIIVRQRDSNQIFEALEQLYTNKSLLDSMGYNSRNRAKNFSWSNITKQYINLYISTI
jgi:glycosyltransferase involved in cell wall biosynthesis